MSANDLRKLKNKKIKENQKKLLTKNNQNVKIIIDNKKGENKKMNYAIACKIPKCKCNGKITLNTDDYERDGSIADGYLTEYYWGICKKCKKEYIITMSISTCPDLMPIQFSIQEN